MGQLFDSMQNYFENGSKKQFLKDWEELKHLNEIGPDILEVIRGYMSQQPLFTLTAEEVEMLEMDILPDSIEEYETHGQWSLHKLEFCKKLLTRIKQWQDEKDNQASTSNTL